MKKSIRVSITVTTILLLGGIIFYPKIKRFFQPKEKQHTAVLSARGGAGQPLYASGYILVPTKMNELIYSTGSLIPDEEVELSFETSGKIVGIYFSEGSRVKKGDLLAKMNDKPLQAQLLKLQAQMK